MQARRLRDTDQIGGRLERKRRDRVGRHAVLHVARLGGYDRYAGRIAAHEVTELLTELLISQLRRVALRHPGHAISECACRARPIPSRAGRTSAPFLSMSSAARRTRSTSDI